MSFLKRACMAITRRISRTIIMFIIFLAIANLILTGIAIQNATESAKVLARQKLGSQITLSFDSEAAMKAAREEMKSSENSSDKKGAGLATITYEAITENMVTQMLENKHITGYNYVVNTNAYASSFEAITDETEESIKDAEEKTQEQIDDAKEQASNANNRINKFNKNQAAMGQGRPGGFGGGGQQLNLNINFDIDMANVVSPDLTVIGVSDYTLDEKFSNSDYVLVQGEGITSTLETTNAVMIEESLAEVNEIKVGDAIKIKASSDGDKISLTVVGIYKAENLTSSNISGMGVSLDYNRLYVKYDTALIVAGVLDVLMVECDGAGLEVRLAVHHAAERIAGHEAVSSLILFQGNVADFFIEYLVGKCCAAFRLHFKAVDAAAVALGGYGDFQKAVLCDQHVCHLHGQGHVADGVACNDVAKVNSGGNNQRVGRIDLCICGSCNGDFTCGGLVHIAAVIDCISAVFELDDGNGFTGLCAAHESTCADDGGAELTCVDCGAEFAADEFAVCDGDAALVVDGIAALCIIDGSRSAFERAFDNLGLAVGRDAQCNAVACDGNGCADHDFACIDGDRRAAVDDVVVADCRDAAACAGVFNGERTAVDNKAGAGCKRAGAAVEVDGGILCDDPICQKGKCLILFQGEVRGGIGCVGFFGQDCGAGECKQYCQSRQERNYLMLHTDGLSFFLYFGKRKQTLCLYEKRSGCRMRHLLHSQNQEPIIYKSIISCFLQNYYVFSSETVIIILIFFAIPYFVPMLANAINIWGLGDDDLTEKKKIHTRIRFIPRIFMVYYKNRTGRRRTGFSRIFHCRTRRHFPLP